MCPVRFVHLTAVLGRSRRKNKGLDTHFIVDAAPVVNDKTETQCASLASGVAARLWHASLHIWRPATTTERRSAATLQGMSSVIP